MYNVLVSKYYPMRSNAKTKLWMKYAGIGNSRAERIQRGKSLGCWICWIQDVFLPLNESRNCLIAVEIIELLACDYCYPLGQMWSQKLMNSKRNLEYNAIWLYDQLWHEVESRLPPIYTPLSELSAHFSEYCPQNCNPAWCYICCSYFFLDSQGRISL